MRSARWRFPRRSRRRTCPRSMRDAAVHGRACHSSGRCRRRPRLLAACRGACPALAVAGGRAARKPSPMSPRRVIDAVVNISTSQTRRRRSGREADAAGAARLAVRGILRGVLQEPPRASGDSAGASNAAAARVNSLGSGFVIDAVGHRRHQQPRHRRRRRGHRHLHRRPQAEGRDRRHATRRPTSRCCA